MAEEAEQRTEEAINVRQVTQVYANWNEEGSGEHGTFSFQLILDNGAEEFVLRPAIAGGTAKMINDLIRQAAGTSPLYFDVERKVLIFGNMAAT